MVKSDLKKRKELPKNLPGLETDLGQFSGWHNELKLQK